ncbi:MAG TPA: IS3 family transposase, partial [Thermoflexales bacterium]|nr:IS3 family transposase [Thermoflexales bacterium]
MLTMICRRRGWRINHKRGERLWKQLRLNARRARAVRKQSPGSSANACDVLRAERPRHVYCCDFI